MGVRAQGLAAIAVAAVMAGTGGGCRSTRPAKATASRPPAPLDARLEAAALDQGWSDRPPRFAASADASVDVTPMVVRVGKGLLTASAYQPLCTEHQGQAALAPVEIVEAFAGGVVEPLRGAIGQTLARTLERHPEATDLLGSLVRQRTVASTAELADVVSWLMVQAMANRACLAFPLSADHAQQLAMAAVLLSTSTDAMYELVFSVAPHLTRDPSSTVFPWFAQRQAVLTTIRLLAAAARASSGAPTVTPYAALAAPSGGALECNPTVEAQEVGSPFTDAAGAALTRDSHFSIVVTCTNRSASRLYSQSLVRAGGPVAGVYDGTARQEPEADLVLPELEPGDEASLVLGPLLVTRAAAEVITLRYDLISSQHSAALPLTLTIRPLDATLVMAAPVVDHDVPGASVASDTAGVRVGSRAELLLAATGAADFELALDAITGLARADGSRLLTEVKRPRSFAAAAQARALSDDVDVIAHEGSGRAGAGSGIINDPAGWWLRLDVRATTSCARNAEASGGVAGALYASICARVEWEKFAALIADLHDTTCQLDAALPSKDGGAAARAGAPGGASTAAVIDPTYAEVVHAIDTLVAYQAIDATELAQALEQLDELAGSPLYPATHAVGSVAVKRERARHLMQSATLARSYVLLLGDKPPRAPIFDGRAAARILRLREELTAQLVKARVLRLLHAASAEQTKARDAVMALDSKTAEMVRDFERVVGELRQETRCATAPVLPEPVTPTSLLFKRFVRVPAVAQ